MSDVFIIESHPLAVPGVDRWVDHREEVWRYELLNTSDEVVDELTGVEEGGTLDFSVHNTIRGTGSLPVSGDEVLAVDWDAHRVAPWFSIDGGVTWEPYGVYLPTTPSVVFEDGTPSATVSLYDKLAIPAGAKTAEWYAVPAGTNPVTAAVTVLNWSGPQRVVAEPTAETLSVPMSWEPNTTHLQIINRLLKSANYFSLTVDQSGVFRMDPYVDPAARGVAWEFRSGVASIHGSRIARKVDSFEIPNRVKLIGTSDGETPALVSAPATDESPTNRYSYLVRGRWVDFVDTVEATSQSVLDALAVRRLRELQAPSASLELEWLPLPLNRVGLNSVVRLVDHPSGLDVPRASLQDFTITMATGARASGRLVELR